MKNLQDFPRIPLAVLPTPIQKLENISRLLNTNVYIKRDDLTGIGLGGTHAGVALGAMLYMPQTKTVGLMVDSDPFEVITTNIMQETAKLLELDFTPTAENVHLIDMCGPGYAIPSPEGNAAIRMMAENEGLFLDPVYTGKAFAGLVKMAREGQFKPTDNVLYLYSGGAGGLFAIDVDLG